MSRILAGKSFAQEGETESPGTTAGEIETHSAPGPPIPDSVGSHDDSLPVIGPGGGAPPIRIAGWPGVRAEARRSPDSDGGSTAAGPLPEPFCYATRATPPFARAFAHPRGRDPVLPVAIALRRPCLSGSGSGLQATPPFVAKNGPVVECLSHSPPRAGGRLQPAPAPRVIPAGRQLWNSSATGALVRVVYLEDPSRALHRHHHRGPRRAPHAPLPRVLGRLNHLPRVPYDAGGMVKADLINRWRSRRIESLPRPSVGRW